MNRSPFFRRRFGNHGSGSLEFALFSGLVVTVLLCGMDLVKYARNRLTLDEVSNSLASLITGYKDLYDSDFPTLYDVSQQTAGRLDVTLDTGLTIFTGITNPNGTPVVAWRRHRGTLNRGYPYNLNEGSSLGPLYGSPTNMPDNYVVPNGSSVVAVEVFSSVQSWTWTLTKEVLGNGSQPTLGSLTMLQPRSALLSQVSLENRP